MLTLDWIDSLPVAATVCDAQGCIVYMNAKAQETFAKQGGARLIGRSLLDCHPPAARAKLAELLTNPMLNAYTIEKGGKKKLIYQTPWYVEGHYAGLVELSLKLPEHLPHFVREN